MDNKIDKKQFEQYLDEAKTWETDKTKDLLKSRKTAWIVAGVSSSITFMAVFAVAALTPLKNVEPYVIRVDNATGIVDVIDAMDDSKTNYDEAVNKYFTQWYVRYREGYSKDLAEDYYENVGIMSVGLEQQKYFEWFNPKNPLSPINVFGQYAKCKVKIKGTSFIKPDVALVRYTKEVERGMDKPQVTHWAATITFRYNGARMQEKDREINPLGFQVVEYRNDPDALPEAATSAPNRAAEPTNNNQTGVTVFPGQPANNAPTVPAIQQQ